MTQQASITALMPVRLKSDSFKEVEWLRHAINTSLAAAAGRDFELLIIDDGSYPPLHEVIADELVDTRIRLLRNRVNLGLIRALNYGLREAKGEFIARIDADDYWEQKRFEVQLQAFERDPALAMSFGGMNLVNEKGEKIEVHVRSFDWAQAIRFSQHVGCGVPHGSILARSRVMRALGGYPYEERSLHSEDFNLWSRLMRFFKVRGEEAIFLNYRIHDQSVSAENRAIQAANSQAIQQEFRRYGPADEFVASMERLAEAMGLSVLELGFKLFELWRYGGELIISVSEVQDLRRVLFDRVVVPQSIAGNQCIVIVSEF